MLPRPLAAPSAENCLTRNEWICGRYFETRAGDLTEALLQHLVIVVASVLLGLLLAIPLALLARRHRRLETVVVGVTTALYTIPSLALFSFSILMPSLHLTRRARSGAVTNDTGLVSRRWT